MKRGLCHNPARFSPFFRLRSGGRLPSAGSPPARATSPKDIPVKKIALALALFLGAAVVLPVLTASTAEAQRSGASANCRYTSSDVAKGYRC